MAYSVSVGISTRPAEFEWEDGPKKILYAGLGMGRPLDDVSGLPTTAIQTDKKNICDVFTIENIVVVSKKFRSIIEEFEPDVHQFFPIFLKENDGTSYDEEYFIFNICQSFCAILVDQSDVHPWSTVQYGPTTGMPYLTGSDDGLVLSRPKIAGRHVWKNWLVCMGLPFFSDELAERMNEEKIRYIDLRRNDEVDEPWNAEENIAPWLEWHRANPELGGEDHS